MVIAEVLNEIKDLEKRRREIQSKMRDSIFILPDLREDEKPDTLEEQLSALQMITVSIAQLKINLIKTNVGAVVQVSDADGNPESITLMEAIKRMESYRYFESQFSELANYMDNKSARYFSHGGYMSQGEAVKLNPNFKTTSKALRARAQEYREASRKVEQALMKANWSTEVK